MIFAMRSGFPLEVFSSIMVLGWRVSAHAIGAFDVKGLFVFNLVLCDGTW